MRKIRAGLILTAVLLTLAQAPVTPGTAISTPAPDRSDAASDTKTAKSSFFPADSKNVWSIYDENTRLFTDNRRVTRSWSLLIHDDLVVYNNQYLKSGAIWPDSAESSIQGMDKNPEFHGLYTANFVDSCIYITKVAADLCKSGKLPKTKNTFQKKLVRAAKKGFRKYEIRNKKDKGMFVYGMALHTAADIFAHSSTGVPGKNRKALKKYSVKKLVKKWGRLKHGQRDPATGGFFEATNMADDNSCVPNRYKAAAKKVCTWLIKHAVMKKKAATKDLFETVSFFKPVSEIEK